MPPQLKGKPMNVERAIYLRQEAKALIGQCPQHRNTCNVNDPESFAPCNCGAGSNVEVWEWLNSLIEKEFKRLVGG